MTSPNAQGRPTVDWRLVLVLWGDKYAASHVNVLAVNAYTQSPTCGGVILMTDRLREGIDDRLQQVLISDRFNRDEFKKNYTIKLSLFECGPRENGLPLVYLDLDTVVIGDLGKIASLVNEKNDIYMLPPGGALGFGLIRRLIFRGTHGRRMAVGNSSVLAFRSDMKPNLADEFHRLRESRPTDTKILMNDDLFISWFGQMRLKPVPNALGVMFRREFLSRARWFGWLKSRLPWVRRRREGIVAVTFNGIEHKLETLLQLPDGSLHHDAKGRFGYWSRQEMGSIKDKIVRRAGLLERTNP